LDIRRPERSEPSIARVQPDWQCQPEAPSSTTVVHGGDWYHSGQTLYVWLCISTPSQSSVQSRLCFQLQSLKEWLIVPLNRGVPFVPLEILARSSSHWPRTPRLAAQAYLIANRFRLRTCVISQAQITSHVNSRALEVFADCMSINNSQFTNLP
jgi:hypothetical protein